MNLLEGVTTSDQGDQIGEFWSGINYKVDKYSVENIKLLIFKKVFIITLLLIFLLWIR